MMPRGPSAIPRTGKQRKYRMIFGTDGIRLLARPCHFIPTIAALDWSAASVIGAWITETPPTIHAEKLLCDCFSRRTPFSGRKAPGIGFLKIYH